MTECVNVKMNYGQSQALKVLAAERMGLKVSDAETAKALLSGSPVHVMLSARLEREACRLHNELRGSEDLVRQANGHVAELQREYGLSV